MNPQTNIPWLDKDLVGVRNCYIYCNKNIIRHKLLARAVSSSTNQGKTLLLSFPPPGRYWSFNFQHLLNETSSLVHLEKLKKDLDIMRIDKFGKPADTSWQDILDTDYTTILADSLTNLRYSRHTPRFSPLKNVTDNMQQLLATTPTLITDSKTAYRPLTSDLESIIQILWQNGPVKHVIKHPRLPRKIEQIDLTSGQKTLEEFAEALAC